MAWVPAVRAFRPSAVAEPSIVNPTARESDDVDEPIESGGAGVPSGRLEPTRHQSTEAGRGENLALNWESDLDDMGEESYTEGYIVFSWHNNYYVPELPIADDSVELMIADEVLIMMGMDRTQTGSMGGFSRASCMQPAT